MGAVAASGGYYIASGCSKIVANPSTITGSIGVILSFPDLEGLFEKLGIKMQTVKSGSLKGAGDISRTLTPAERAMLQAAIDDTHAQFVKDVSETRKMPLARVEDLATGGIYTGRMAKNLGLVDKLGGFETALETAAQMAGISDTPQLVRPESSKKNWVDRIFEEKAEWLIQRIQLELYGKGLDYRWQPE
jgi:protease-4